MSTVLCYYGGQASMKQAYMSKKEELTREVGTLADVDELVVLPNFLTQLGRVSGGSGSTG